MTRAPGGAGVRPAEPPGLRSSLVRLGIGVALGVVVLLGEFGAAIPQSNGPRLLRPLDGWGALLIVLAVAVTVVGLRAAPLLSLTGSLLLVNAYLLLHYPYGPLQLCIVVAMYEVARRRPFAQSLVICGAAATVSSAVMYVR